jgi:hypothetical protein
LGKREHRKPQWDITKIFSQKTQLGKKSIDRKKFFQYTIVIMTESGHSGLNNAENYSHFEMNSAELGMVLALSLSLSLSLVQMYSSL